MTFLQNQSVEAPPNVLHDQGIPNTLTRTSLAAVPIGQMRLPAGVFLAFAVTVVGLLAILAVRLA